MKTLVSDNINNILDISVAELDNGRFAIFMDYTDDKFQYPRINNAGVTYKTIFRAVVDYSKMKDLLQNFYDMRHHKSIKLIPNGSTFQTSI